LKYILLLLCGLLLLSACSFSQDVSGYHLYAEVQQDRCDESEPLGEPTQEVFTPVPVQCYVKVSGTLNVREVPNGTVVGRLYDGYAVNIYEEYDNWLRIGVNRWVYKDYVECNQ
jgi:hypothetical protein